MDAMQVAARYSAQQTALAKQVADEAAKLWAGLDPARLDASWAAIAPQVQALTSGAMVLAASAADAYLDDVLTAQGIDPASSGAVDARTFGQAASDGRPLDSLLREPLIGTKASIGSGASTAQALVGGLLQLDMILRTQIADAGRTAVGAGLTARRHATGYVRMLNPPSCSRCAVLAGRHYRWNAGFARHPRCDCRHIPTAEDVAGDLRTDPAAYFKGLSRAEQDRLFTRAGAEAIRDGADLGQVVNARRKGGLYTAGGKKYTRESTTRRGVLPKRQRLTPEQIYKDAAGDRDKAIRLLKENKYLWGEPTRPPVLTFAQRAEAAAKEAKALQAAPVGLSRTVTGGLDGTQRDFLRQYKGTAYVNVNGVLRRQSGNLPGGFGFAFYREITASIDKVLARSLLTSDVLVYRGVQSGSAVFGGAWARSLTGAEWTEHAYLSTSASRAVSQAFGHSGGAVMRIVARRGTGAVELSGMDYEAELLLRRGLRLRVVADTGPGPGRVIDVEIVR